MDWSQESASAMDVREAVALILALLPRHLPLSRFLCHQKPGRGFTFRSPGLRRGLPDPSIDSTSLETSLKSQVSMYS